jgi:hypothetical protein
MLAAAAAFPEAAVIKGERDEPGQGEQFGVAAGDLLLDPGEGTGNRDSGPTVIGFGTPELAHQLNTFATEGDPLSLDGGHEGSAAV